MLDVPYRKAVNVHIVTSNRIHVTRKDILKWLGGLLCKELKRVEDLANGSIYCVVMNQLFPGSIPIHKVKMHTRTETEALSNFRLLSNSFEVLEVKKDIPMESLVKGTFSDNFRFAQWFKLFYDANSQCLPLEDEYLDPTADRHQILSADAPKYVRRSQSVSHRNKWKVKSPPVRQNNSVRNRPLHPSTRPSPRLAPSKSQARGSEQLVQDNGASTKKDQDMHKKDTEDTSDMVSVDASDLSTSDGLHPAKFVKANSAWSEPPKSDVLLRDSPSSTKPHSEPTPKSTPSMPPNPKRRTNTSQQLPPPSPSFNQYPIPTVNRFASRPQLQANLGSPTPQSYQKNLQGSGDRPTPVGLGRSNVRSNITPRLAQAVPIDASQLTQSRETSDEESTKRFASNSTSRFGHRMTTHDGNIPSITNLAKSESSTPMPTMRELQMNHVLSSEIVSESELQRELAILRYGTIEQRRTLFFCQKEAQFYFKKLLRIEALCQRLDHGGDKALKKLLDTIFGILYETEDGFMCPDEIRT